MDTELVSGGRTVVEQLPPYHSKEKGLNPATNAGSSGW
jgi:hypothetical protein